MSFKVIAYTPESPPETAESVGYASNESEACEDIAADVRETVAAELIDMFGDAREDGGSVTLPELFSKYGRGISAEAFSVGGLEQPQRSDLVRRQHGGTAS